MYSFAASDPAADWGRMERLMSNVSKSPRATLRRSVREVYRARSKGNSNLWLIYSVKTNKDWILTSDRQLIHWLYYLESACDVVSFDLASEPVLSIDGREARKTELNAIAVFKDGHIEWHEIKAEARPNSSDRSQLLSQAAAAANEGVKYVVFDDRDFRPIARIALRWLKPLGFAEVLRGQEEIPCRIAIATYVNDKKSGTIKTLVTDLSLFDPQIIIGMLVRLAVAGAVDIDLKPRPFGWQTRWCSHG